MLLGQKLTSKQTELVEKVEKKLVQLVILNLYFMAYF